MTIAIIIQNSGKWIGFKKKLTEKEKKREKIWVKVILIYKKHQNDSQMVRLFCARMPNDDLATQIRDIYNDFHFRWQIYW